jgi:hypothetical protein
MIRTNTKKYSKNDNFCVDVVEEYELIEGLYNIYLLYKLCLKFCVVSYSLFFKKVRHL